MLLAVFLTAAVVLLGWQFAGLTGADADVRRLKDVGGTTIEWTDAAAEATVEDVEARTVEWKKWSSPRSESIGEGNAHWLRITLRNSEGKEWRGVLSNQSTYLDQLDFYIKDGEISGKWLHSRSGEQIAPKERTLWGKPAAFPVTVPAGGETTVYLRAEDYFSAYLVPEWWEDERGFHIAQAKEILAEGLYFGMVLALLFYNGVLWARLRFPDTGAYLLYLVFFAVFILVSRGNLPLLGVPAGSPFMEMILTAALASSGFFLMEFARRLLDLPARSQGAAKALRTAQALLEFCAVSVISALWIRHALDVIWIMSAAAHIFLLSSVIVAWRRGARGMRYLVLMFGLVFSGIMPALVVWLEVFSIKQSGVIVMMGSAVEMLLLSLAVAYRYSGIQRDKIAAQTELLREAEQRRVIEEAYADELGLEVFERTRELQGMVEDKDRMIAILAHDLGSPLTGMARRARQLADVPEAAALSDFARESAETGERMLSMIDDLVHWAKQRGCNPALARHPVSAVILPMVSLHQEAVRRLGISLELSVPENLEVETDLVQAQTLVRNLLSNAIKFANGKVHVSARLDDRHVRLSIRDDGPGLPAPVEARLSGEPDDSMESGGGLGLRLCQEIGRVLGVRLRADAVDEGGTEFSFFLQAVEGGNP